MTIGFKGPALSCVKKKMQTILMLDIDDDCWIYF